MKIEKNKVVLIDYVLNDENGNEIDSSKASGPLEYLHGYNNLIPGLEVLLEGKVVSDKFSAVVSPKDAYGDYNPKLVVEVPRTQFDPDLDVQIGMSFQAQTNSGENAIVHVIKVAPDVITVDANHELAGKTLYFDVEVQGVRDATEEEIMRGGVNLGCCGGCSSCGGGCSGSSAGCAENCANECDSCCKDAEV